MLSEEEDGFGVSSRLLGLLLLGITFIFVGIAVLLIAFVSLGGSGSVSGVIFIGPIPIVFGAGPDSTLLIIISVVIAILSISVVCLDG